MARSAINWRLRTINRSRQEPVPDRGEYLKELVSAKNVLDIGVVEHEAARSDLQNWLHGQLVAASEECLGVDIAESGIAHLKGLGFNVLCCDVTDPDARKALGGTFQVIVCGELVEHLSSPGDLFSAAADLMTDDGRLVVTTPNPYLFTTILRHIVRPLSPRDSVDHVLYCFPSGMAEMAERANLQLEAFRGTLHATASPVHRATFRLGRLLRRLLNHELFCTTMIYEFVRPAKEN